MFLLNEFTNDLRVLKEAKSLIQNGYFVRIIALKGDSTLAAEIIEKIEVERIDLWTRKLLPKNYFSWFIKYIEFIFKAFTKGCKLKPSVVHCHDLPTLIIGYCVGRILKVTIVYDSHELYYDRNFPLIIYKAWYYIEKFLIKRIDYLIVENDSRGKVMQNRYNIQDSISIRNCQYLNLLKNNKFLREKLGLNDKNKIIIYQGVVSKERGLEIAIQMMQYLPQYYVLVIVGFGEYNVILNEKLAKLSISNIFLLGGVSLNELPKYTSSADIGVSFIQNVNLNHYYALSNKIFEYLSAGLPVVFSDFPEMKKIIIDNEVGFVVDETNPKEAALAVKKILSNPSLYKTMSYNAKNIVKNRFNWEFESQKLLELYNKIDN